MVTDTEDPMAPMIVPPIEVDQPLFKWYQRPTEKPEVHSLEQIEAKREALRREGDQ